MIWCAQKGLITRTEMERVKLIDMDGKLSINQHNNQLRGPKSMIQFESNN